MAREPRLNAHVWQSRASGRLGAHLQGEGRLPAINADRGRRVVVVPARLRWPAFLLLVAAATLLTYFLLGARIETAAHAALDVAAARPALVALLVVALLTGDVVLPIPSSVVGAFAGAALGTGYGTAAVWTGLMLGCMLGYWLGRAAAPALGTEVDATSGRPGRVNAGPLMVVATRAVPILAETGIIAAGAARMRFTTMIAAAAPANLLVALAYAGAGALLAASDPGLVAVLSTIMLAAAWAVILLVCRKRSAPTRS